MQSLKLSGKELSTLDSAMLVTDICEALRSLDEKSQPIDHRFTSFDSVLEMFKTSPVLDSNSRSSIIVFANQHTSLGDKLAATYCEMLAENASQFMVIGCRAFGDTETIQVMAESFEAAAIAGALEILSNLHEDYNDDIYINAVVDKDFNTKTDFVFEVSQLMSC